MKRGLLVMGLLVFLADAFSQKVLLDIEPRKLYGKNWGPNLKHYVQWVFSYSNYIPLNRLQNETMQFLSFTGNAGYRYKYKISHRFAAGAEASLNFSHLLINPELNKAKNSGMSFNGMVFTEPEGAFFFRINKKTGNQLSFFVDIGFFAGSNFLYSFYKINDDKFIDKISLVKVNDEYFNKSVTGLFLRMGYKNIALKAKYRFTGFFSEKGISVVAGQVNSQDQILPFDVPALSMDLEIGIGVN